MFCFAFPLQVYVLSAPFRWSHFNHLSFVDGFQIYIFSTNFQQHLCPILSNVYMMALPESFNVTYDSARPNQFWQLFT